MLDEQTLTESAEALVHRASACLRDDALVTANLMGGFASPPYRLSPVNDLDVFGVYESVTGSLLHRLKAAFEQAERDPGDGVSVVTRFVNGPVKIPPIPGVVTFLFHVSIYDRAGFSSESPLLLANWHRAHRHLAGEPMAQAPVPRVTYKDVLSSRLGVSWSLAMLSSRTVPYASWLTCDGKAKLQESHLPLDEEAFGEMLHYAVLHAVENTATAHRNHTGADGRDEDLVKEATGLSTEKILERTAALKKTLRSGSPIEIKGLAKDVREFLLVLSEALKNLAAS